MWQVDLYITDSGKSPIQNFINHLEPSQKGKVITAVNLLKEFGPYLTTPHSKKLIRFLHELRTSGKAPIRLLYSHSGQKFIILHAFIKKSPKTPAKEIATALKRLTS